MIFRLDFANGRNFHSKFDAKEKATGAEMENRTRSFSPSPPTDCSLFLSRLVVVPLHRGRPDQQANGHGVRASATLDREHGPFFATLFAEAEKQQSARLTLVFHRHEHAAELLEGDGSVAVPVGDHHHLVELVLVHVDGEAAQDEAHLLHADAPLVLRVEPPAWKNLLKASNFYHSQSFQKALHKPRGVGITQPGDRF